MRRVLGFLAVGAVVGFLVACNPQADTSVKSKSAGNGGEAAAGKRATAEATRAGNSSPEEYQPVEPSELDCSAALSGRVSWSADGKVDGSIDELICNGKSIELKSKEVKGGSLITKDFGTVLIKPGNAAAFTMQLWMTRDQKERVKKWVNVASAQGPVTTQPGEEQKEASYEFVPPKELALEIQDFYYNGAVAADGVKPNGGEVGKLSCAGKAIELASSEFEDGHIVTKEFGKIRVRFSSSLTSEGFAVFLTPTQKLALRKFCAG